MYSNVLRLLVIIESYTVVITIYLFNLIFGNTERITLKYQLEYYAFCIFELYLFIKVACFTDVYVCCLEFIQPIVRWLITHDG